MKNSVDTIVGRAGVARQLGEKMHAVVLGGHFPGSLVLHWENKLFIADTFITVPVSRSFYPSFRLFKVLNAQMASLLS